MARIGSPTIFCLVLLSTLLSTVLAANPYDDADHRGAQFKKAAKLDSAYLDQKCITAFGQATLTSTSFSTATSTAHKTQTVRTATTTTTTKSIRETTRPTVYVRTTSTVVSDVPEVETSTIQTTVVVTGYPNRLRRRHAAALTPAQKRAQIDDIFTQLSQSDLAGLKRACRKKTLASTTVGATTTIATTALSIKTLIATQKSTMLTTYTTIRRASYVSSATTTTFTNSVPTTTTTTVVSTQYVTPPDAGSPYVTCPTRDSSDSVLEVESSNDLVRCRYSSGAECTYKQSWNGALFGSLTGSNCPSSAPASKKAGKGCFNPISQCPSLSKDFQPTFSWAFAHQGATSNSFQSSLGCAYDSLTCVYDQSSGQLTSSTGPDGDSDLCPSKLDGQAWGYCLFSN